MYADRVEVLHRTYCYNVALGVTHNFKLDLFPACDALLYQYLSDRREVQTVSGYLDEFFFIINDTAACAAQCECGSDDKREAYALLLGECNSILNGINYL